MALPDEVVIYDDLPTTYVTGSFTLTNQYGTWSYPSSSGFNRLFRKGRRRPKPKYLDATPYEIYKAVSTGIRGDWWTDRGLPSQQHRRGLMSFRPEELSRFKPNGKEIDSNFSDIARVKALSKLNHKDLDLGTAFAEFGKTAQFVGDLATWSVGLMRAAKRRDGKEFISRLSADVSHRLPMSNGAVDGYLAYHYAVKPMLKDVAGMVQSLTRLPPEEWRIRTKGQYSNDRSRRVVKPLGHGMVTIETDLRESARCVVSATKRMLTAAEDLRWSLGLDDPLSTAWELTPFSFVYDWIVPVGDWLSAINASKYFTDWSVVTTDYIKETTVITGAKQKNGASIMESSVRGAFESLYIKRSVGTSIPFTTLPIIPSLSLDHAAKGISLFASQLARSGEGHRFLRV